ncbi:MAG: Smr/MutS family protein [Candidatus Cryptobacteroides sp.]|nr:Smr/MutS family protein [Candidatus Cryptobacteroides sp.]
MEEDAKRLRLETKLGFDRVRREVADRCNTDYAVQRVENENFSNDPEEIRQRLLLTDEMRLVLMFEDKFPTTGYIDALPFLVPLEKEGSSIDVLSLGKLGTLLDTISKILAFLSSVKDGVYPNLTRLALRARRFPEIGVRINSILDRYGEVKDSASPELLSIRRTIRDMEGTLSKRAAAILRKAQDDGYADKDASVAVRDGKFLIPVASASKRKVSGFIYDESSTGKTTYIEPTEIIDLENEIRDLRFEESREIARILREFSEFVRPFIPELKECACCLGEMDFLMAKAGTALNHIAGMPVISEDGRLELRKARHPLLEKALRKEGRKMNPLTVHLSREQHILLISGPNAGGKSVCMKTAGLLQYMFQWGLLIPTSESSELPVFDRILVSIGDDQSLDNDLSTYSSFLADMRDILSCADSKTLVLIDEFGSGTEPAAGGAIAEAILSELDRRGVYGVITTHYTNLKLYAASGKTGVINGAMLFDAARIEPVFELETGLPGNSFAFELARKMKLPEPIVKDAESRAGEEYVGIERNLRRIVRGRKAIDERLQKIKATDKTLEGLTERYQKELEDIRGMREKILDEARREAEGIIRGAGRQVERTIREIKESQADKQRTLQVRNELQNMLSAIENSKTSQSSSNGADFLERKLKLVESRQKKKGKPQGWEKTKPEAPLQIGEKVRVKDSGMVGEVTRLSGKTVTVNIGNLQASMSPVKLERISSNEFREAARSTFTRAVQPQNDSLRERKLNFRTELDVRGERLNDAIDIVTHYIDDALMLSMGSVRIIHGKGTGVLRDEIQKYLRTVPGVASAEDEDIRHGGSGVTVVTFV